MKKAKAWVQTSTQRYGRCTELGKGAHLLPEVRQKSGWPEEGENPRKQALKLVPK